MEKGSTKVTRMYENTEPVAARVIEYRKTTIKAKRIQADASHEGNEIARVGTNLKKNSRTCADKEYCGNLVLDANTCNGFKRLQQDCPASCQKCAICKDNKKCKLYGDIKNICQYLPEAQTLCPKSCGTCTDESKKFYDALYVTLLLKS